MESASPRYSLDYRRMRYAESLFLQQQYIKNASKQQIKLLDVLNSDKDINNETYKSQSFMDIYNKKIDAPIRECREYNNFLYERYDLSFERFANNILKFAVGVVAFGAGMYFARPSAKTSDPELKQMKLTDLQRN